MRELSRRRVLEVGTTLLGAVAAGQLLGVRPATARATAWAAAGETVTLADDFTVLGTQEIIGRTILDSGGTPYTWTQLYPSPAWRRGPYFSTGDPGIVDGRLQRRDATTAMYPGLSLPGVPSRVEVDFVYDVHGLGGRSVFVHLFADTDGNRASPEVPFHLSVGEKGYSVKAISTAAGDTVLTGYGDFPDRGSIKYDGRRKLRYGVVHTLTLDFVGDTVTIGLPVAAGTAPVTLTDSRLTSAQHPGGGSGRFLVLEDESDARVEPYNAFSAVRVVL